VTYYVAKAGDSLWSIANKFDLDVNTLIGCNRMGDMNVLKPGITLRIPNQDGIFVTVKAGDTLKGLADRLEVFPEAVASANGLSLDGALTAGKSLFVPGAKPVAYFEAETKAGRTGGAVERISGRSGFGWPVVGRINSPFGWRGDPFSGRRDFHTGVDIKGPTGRGIAAAASGRVVYAGWMSGYGKTVVIEHPGGYTTLYGHCSSLLCREGSRVSRGDLIARVGSTGRSTGSHLHFEVRVGGTPVNPLRYLR
jgi:murein DD-endopeptidase MepM/ murein hydrolase activator NlpD